MKLSGIPYSKYIREQLKAVRDAKIKGFFFWNARQKYTIPLRVTREFYSTQKVSRREKISAEKGKRDNSI
jgi:hypothetical protein